ncbi:EpsG family protein [Dolichospermum planctonicum UHCC 0167]|uniref:EpsG family protein n=1 Tax=Dolichospermum planctonicum TaxID=136072 RepID=UPI00144338A6|nr:EpsG family protein [Dolichospermum planctonicum]MCW9679328.1 EpsG family protein [Dolichospermum planctonicum UHCC 0167]
MKTHTQNLAVPQENVSNVNQYIIVFLCISLAVWMYVPIIGIFPLLLFIQLNLLNNKNPGKKIGLINNLLLILVVFTICVFFTSYTIYSDLIVYVQTYEQLGNMNAFEATVSYGTGTEFIPFLIAYLVYHLTSGSVYAYLFVHALIINVLIVFVISKRLSRKYYPVILMLVFSAPFYYWQIIIMRHALSNTFLMAAISFMESSSISFLSFLILSFFSHSSNIINICILSYFKFSEFNIFYFKNNFSVVKNSKKTKSTKIKFISLIFVIILYVFLSGGVSISAFLPLILPILSNFVQINSGLENRLTNYDNYGKMIGGSIFDITIFIFMTITVIFFFLKRKEFSRKLLSLITIFLLQMISYFYGTVSTINWRIYYLLLSMSGLFYLPLIEMEKGLSPINGRNYKNNIFIISIAIVLAYNILMLFRGLAGGWIVAKEHIFFNGIPLKNTIFDYIVFFINANTT